MAHEERTSAIGLRAKDLCSGRRMGGRSQEGKRRGRTVSDMARRALLAYLRNKM